MSFKSFSTKQNVPANASAADKDDNKTKDAPASDQPANEPASVPADTEVKPKS